MRPVETTMKATNDRPFRLVMRAAHRKRGLRRFIMQSHNNWFAQRLLKRLEAGDVRSRVS